MTRIVPRPMGRQVLWAAAWLFFAVAVAEEAASAQAVPPCDTPVLTTAEAARLLRVDEDEVQRLAEQGKLPARRIGSSWRFNCDALMAWLSGDGHPPLTTQDLSAVTAAGTSQGQDKTPPPGDAALPADGAQRPVGEAPEERPAEEVLLRGQRVLLNRGDAVVDVGQFYSRSDSQFLASVDGLVGLATTRQQVLTTLLIGRVGIFDETELFAGTTFHRQDDRQFLGSTDIADSRHSDLGEVQIGVRRTLLREGAGRPDIILAFDSRIPTGDTPYAVGAGLVLVKSIDPVVLFAGANYLRAFARDSLTLPSAWPKNRWDVSLGYGLGLNDTVAISMAVSGAFVGATALDRSATGQPGVFSARLGLTSWLAKGLYIEPSVSFALNGPADSFAFAVTLPYTF